MVLVVLEFLIQPVENMGGLWSRTVRLERNESWWLDRKPCEELLKGVLDIPRELVSIVVDFLIYPIYTPRFVKTACRRVMVSDDGMVAKFNADGIPILLLPWLSVLGRPLANKNAKFTIQIQYNPLVNVGCRAQIWIGITLQSQKHGFDVHFDGESIYFNGEWRKMARHIDNDCCFSVTMICDHESGSIRFLVGQGRCPKMIDIGRFHKISPDIIPQLVPYITIIGNATATIHPTTLL